MYVSRIVEDAPIDTVFEAPAHPYTSGLLAALPRARRPAPRAGADRRRCQSRSFLANLPPRLQPSRRVGVIVNVAAEDGAAAAGDLAGRRPPRRLHPRMTALLDVSNLSRAYDVRRGSWPFARHATLLAVDGVSFELSAGRTLGLVGETGLRQDDDRPSFVLGLDAGHRRAGAFAGERADARLRAAPPGARCGSGCRWSIRTRWARSTGGCRAGRQARQPLAIHGTWHRHRTARARRSR